MTIQVRRHTRRSHMVRGYRKRCGTWVHSHIRSGSVVETHERNI